MTSFPRIYSLSTVGVLKHYVHDYLFHPERTDFIGSNGVGKSIIADLMQLMFIYDTDLIRFGTDGVKKDERQIYTLPYLSKIAYCFLNIELDTNRYITLGIQIPGQKGKRIIPFMVSKDADSEKPKEELTFGSKELLFANDLLLDDGKGKHMISDIREVALYLRNERNLFLNAYQTRDDVNSYYRFLYSKEILPLNLSQETNLKAYAKVIQSFSKAKTLNLSGNQASRSLKEFLFEGSDEDILNNYHKQQKELEQILKDYDSLSKDIQSLSLKFDKLSDLRKKETEVSANFKIYKQIELNGKYAEWQKHCGQESEKRKMLSNLESRLSGIQVEISGFPEKEMLLKRKVQECDDNIKLFDDFLTLISNIEQIQQDLNELNVMMLPDLDDSWKGDVDRVDVNLVSNEQIKTYIDYVKLFIEKYGTLAETEKRRDEQSIRLVELTSSLKGERVTKCKLRDMLKGDREDGLLRWYLHNLPDVNEEQLQAILFYATTSVEIKSRPDDGAIVIEPEELLKHFHTTSTDEGLWVRHGAFHQFIKRNPDSNVFANKEIFRQSVGHLLDRITGEITIMDRKLEALNKIRDGHSYDISLFDEIFDPSISSFESIEKLRTAVAHILQLDERTELLRANLMQRKGELAKIKKQFDTDYDEPDIIRKHLINNKEEWRDKNNSFHQEKGRKLAESDSIAKEIRESKSVLDGLINEISVKQEQFEVLYKAYYDFFEENFDALNNVDVDVQSAKSSYESQREEYKSMYIKIVGAFDETRDGKNTAVDVGISTQRFSFRELEEALLGARIRSTDEIVDALRDANTTREQIANGIRDGMLRIFGETIKRYERCESQVKDINAFFVGRKISGKFYFKLDFNDSTPLQIENLRRISHDVRKTASKGEFQFGQPLGEFIEDFFKSLAKLKEKIKIEQLLNPKTFFELSAKLTDQSGSVVPGSTGESYSALALLGVARLSAVQRVKRKGLRFIILEELGSLDNTNFNTFPAIAKEFQYQIITMAPHTFNIGLSEEWYAHHLIKGRGDENINYRPSASYFKTDGQNQDLEEYLSNISKNELD